MSKEVMEESQVWWCKELQPPERTKNDVNPTGYVAGGNLDFNRRPRPRYLNGL